MSWLRGAFLAVVTALIVALGLGYIAFANGVERAAPQHPLPEADAIVALTGGDADRLTTAMKLLQEGRGRRLLISGVNPKVEDADVYDVLEGAPELIACCVDLGRQAKDTLGNASETAAWAGRNGFSRLIVVTDDYHMPRSLAELRVAMPQAQLIPYPVSSSLSTPGAWQRDLSAAMSLGGEYVKYLAIRAREAFLTAEKPTETPPAA
ncbi:MAG: YdcF family protein [Alphaproteobacteria bacterium]|nr:YdcF family protein [Alphaproteobacteria bacterium]